MYVFAGLIIYEHDFEFIKNPGVYHLPEIKKHFSALQSRMKQPFNQPVYDRMYYL